MTLRTTTERDTCNVHDGARLADVPARCDRYDAERYCDFFEIEVVEVEGEFACWHADTRIGGWSSDRASIERLADHLRVTLREVGGEVAV